MTSRPRTNPSLQLCRYYSAGRCSKGSDCKFSHDNEGSLASPCQSSSTSILDSSATYSPDESQKTCRYWKAGNCKNAWDCKFSHGSEDSWASECRSTSTSTAEAVNIPASRSPDENQKLCRYWKAGNCKNGSDCKFSHGSEDSWASECPSTSTSTVEAVSPPATHPVNESQKICRYWKAGNCKSGSDCKFSHGNEDSWASECRSTSVEAVNSLATHSTDENQVCPYLKAGNCKNAWDCKFSHGSEDSWASECRSTSTSTVEAVNTPASRSSDENQKLCRYWKAGNCKNGSDCKFSHGSEDSWASECPSTSTSTVEAVSSPATHPTNESQKICRYWKAGNCKSGSDCKFSHGNEDSWASECRSTSVEAVNSLATHSTDENQVCPYWKAGNCKNAWDCKFSHGNEDSWASECPSASTSTADEADNLSATHSTNGSQKICRYWKAGNCKNGSDCKFSHGSEDSWASECRSASTSTVEAGNSPATHSTDESQICPYWKAGNCKNAWDCKFSHGNEDSWASECPSTSTSTVEADNSCATHSTDGNQICPYLKAGNCKNAWDCKFSHGNEDSWASECPSVSTGTVEATNAPATHSADESQVCPYWKAGNCKNAWDCRFLHGYQDSWASECPSVSTGDVEKVDSIATHSPDESQKICRYWKAGNCKNAWDCKFSHESDDSWASECQNAPTTVEAVNPTVTHLSEESQKICRYWKAGHCTNGSDCEFPHGYQDSPPTPHPQDDRQRICRYWKAGNCKNAWDCKFSHASEDSRTSECQSPSTTTIETVNPSANQSRDERRRLCYYWKMGNCKYGRECKFLHGSEDSLASDCRSSSTSATEVVSPLPALKRRTLCRYWKAGNCIRGDICWFHHANDEPANSKIAQREAAETIGRAVQGPIVTLSAGLDIIGLTAGFESCILHVKNISAGAKEDDLRALMSQQGVDADRIYLVGVKTVGGGKVEAGVMTDE